MTPCASVGLRSAGLLLLVVIMGGVSLCHAAEDTPAAGDERAARAIALAWSPRESDRARLRAYVEQTSAADEVVGRRMAFLELMSRPRDADFLAGLDDAAAWRLALPERRALRVAQSRVAGESVEDLQAAGRHNRFASIFNAMAGLAVRLVQFDFSAITRVGLAVGRALGYGDLTPRERKELFVLERHALPSSSPRDPHRLSPEIEGQLERRRSALETRQQVAREGQLRRLADEATRQRRFEEARGWIARLPEALQQPLRERLEAAEARARRERSGGTRVAPDYAPLLPVERPLLHALLAGNAARVEAERRAAVARRPQWAGTLAARHVQAVVGLRARRPAMARQAFEGLPADHPLRHEVELFPELAAERAEQLRRAEVRYVIWRGQRRPADDAYIALYGAAGGPAGALGAGIVLGGNALIRAVASAFRSPVEPVDFSDAAMHAAASPMLSKEDRTMWRMRAMQAWSDAGMPERAMRLDGATRQWLELAAPDEALLAELREETARQFLRRASDTPPGPERRERLQAVGRLYPGTRAATIAAERLSDLDEESGIDAASGELRILADDLAPGGSYAKLAGLIPLAPELIPPVPRGAVGLQRLVITPARLPELPRAEAHLSDGRMLPLPVGERLAAMAFAHAEALRTEGRLEEGYQREFRRQILPIGVEGGIGGSGVDFTPRIREIPFRDRDAHLFREAR